MLFTYCLAPQEQVSLAPPEENNQIQAEVGRGV